MATRDSHTPTQENNPQKAGGLLSPEIKTTALYAHLDAFSDSLAAFRFALYGCTFVGESSDQKIGHARFMVDALQGEMTKFFDSVLFGDIVDEPCISNKLYHLHGLLHLVDSGLSSMQPGHRNDAPASLDPTAIARLFELVGSAFEALRKRITNCLELEASQVNIMH
jgi:hypothetical protein